MQLTLLAAGELFLLLAPVLLHALLVRFLKTLFGGRNKNERIAHTASQWTTCSIGQWRFGRSGRVCVVVVVVTCKGIGEKQEMHQKCNRKRNKKRQRERETINLNHSGPKKENRNKTQGSTASRISNHLSLVLLLGLSSFGEHLFSNLSSSL